MKSLISDFVLLAAVLFSVLAWGSNEPWAMGLVSAVILTLGAIRMIWGIWKPTRRFTLMWFYLPVSILLIGIAAGIVLGNRFSLLFRSVERSSTIVFLFWALSYIAAVSLTHMGLDSRRQIRTFLISVIALGAFEAVYGLVQYLGGYDYIWQFSKEYYKGLATGTLINRNHYALLMNLCICTGAGYLYYRCSRMLGGYRLTWKRVLGAPGVGKLAWVVFWLAIMGLGVIFSMSRMGIAAMIIGAGTMVVACNRAEAGRRATAMGLLVIVLALGFSIYIGVDAILARYEEISKERESNKDRIALWRDAWKMIEKRPWFGQGLGTFQWTFPAYESVDPDIPAKYAHNDYLQSLAEVGMVGLALLLWAFGCVWSVALKNLRHPKDPLIRGIGLGTIGALTIIALQEITDFGLYIPGVALLAAILVGLNLRAQSLGQETALTD